MNNTIRPDLNRPETKEQFFAQYWWQRVLIDVDHAHNRQVYPIVVSNMYRIEVSHLILTSLANITDEDAIACANLLGNCSHLSDLAKVSQIRELLTTNYFYTKQTNITANQWLKLFDYLRSNGYALPWIGYTVEELIEAGYCQLKGGERG